VIDSEAKEKLETWITRMQVQGRLRFRWSDARPMPKAGTYVAPTIVTLEHASDLTEEIFGPVLHFVRWRADELGSLIDAIATNGYGLTLGIHSRIDSTVEEITARLAHGNLYVNRNMIGAVVGTQPFGGGGLSGTGPKAGGPHYLPRFAAEQVITVNTTAAGGNASLLAEPDE
jgi:RHH-type proline utilization regulon transcriptional repressor/proline dehydrogenase/delta 1-pyrroline-5-carboxylate dehydrogenase